MWAGGKSKLVKRYSNIWPDSSQFTNYIEPFFGGGAVYGWMQEQDYQYTIGDINSELMGLLTEIKTNFDNFITASTELAQEYLSVSSKDDRKTWFYNLRKEYWRNPTNATLFVLMKLGFNGIWQTCREAEGKFATPSGLLNQVALEQIINVDLLKQWHKALTHTTIHTGSYMTIPVPNEKSLIYLDPPYRGSFTTYGGVFDDEDQYKLVRWAETKASQGHMVILANRTIPGDRFFETLLPDAKFVYFDVTYTAGRRKAVTNGYEAKKAVEFVALLNPS